MFPRDLEQESLHCLLPDLLLFRQNSAASHVELLLQRRLPRQPCRQCGRCFRGLRHHPEKSVADYPIWLLHKPRLPKQPVLPQGSLTPRCSIEPSGGNPVPGTLENPVPCTFEECAQCQNSRLGESGHYAFVKCMAPVSLAPVTAAVLLLHFRQVPGSSFE